MNEEQKEILQMVSEGKITADDGVKLLDALQEGEQKRKEKESPAKRMKRQRKMLSKSMKGNVMGLENMNEIGHMVRNIVSDAVSGITGGQFTREFDIDENRFEDCGILDGVIELEEGTELFITTGRSHKGSDLILEGVDGSGCAVVGEDSPEVHVYRDNGSVWLKWDGGDLSLNVPETVSKLNASIMGGDIAVTGVKTQVNIKTKGGDINILDASYGFSAKTMGGDIIISLTDFWDEDSNVSTMGGDISLSLSGDAKADISAKTFGGEITVQEGIGEVTKSGQYGSSRVRVCMSGDEDAPDMKLRTMGGDISIEKREMEEERRASEDDE